MLVKAAGQGRKSNHGSPFHFACATASKSHRSANAKGRIWVCRGVFLLKEWGHPAGAAAPSLPGRSDFCSPGFLQLLFIPATVPRYRPCSCTPHKAGDCSGHCYHCNHNSMMKVLPIGIILSSFKYQQPQIASLASSKEPSISS